MTTLTDWYDPKVDGQPVRVGWYQRKYSWPANEGLTDWWDGENWIYGTTDGEITRDIARVQDRPWRGLTEPNEEKQ